MITNRFLSADTAASNNSFASSLKDFFTELLYGGSGERYENFSFGNQLVTYRMIIIAVAIGIIIASAVMVYKRKYLGSLVRALSMAGALEPESAKTLGELGLSHSRSIRMSLKNGTLKRMIRSTERDKYEEKVRSILEENAEKKDKNKVRIIGDFVPSPTDDKYYLPAEKEKEMLVLFSEKGSGIVGFILTVVFCILAAALLFVLVPWMIKLLDSAL